jgi:hypothetical protein
MSLEIKSMALKDSQNEWIYYHGIVNNEEDFIAKDFGSQFDAIELKYFSDIALKLLDEKYLASDDLRTMESKPDRWNNSKVEGSK